MSVQIRELSDTELNMVSGGGHPPLSTSTSIRPLNTSPSATAAP
jgi:hypothetical protein